METLFRNGKGKVVDDTPITSTSQSIVTKRKSKKKERMMMAVDEGEEAPVSILSHVNKEKKKKKLVVEIVEKKEKPKIIHGDEELVREMGEESFRELLGMDLLFSIHLSTEISSSLYNHFLHSSLLFLKPS